MPNESERHPMTTYCDLIWSGRKASWNVGHEVGRKDDDKERHTPILEGTSDTLQRVEITGIASQQAAPSLLSDCKQTILVRRHSNEFPKGRYEVRSTRKTTALGNQRLIRTSFGKHSSRLPNPPQDNELVRCY